MKRCVALFLVLILFNSFYMVANAEKELPDTIKDVDDLKEYLDYACENGTYGHVNDENSVVDMDCSGLVKFIYSKMGYTGSAWDIVAKGEVITNLSKATPGDIVVWKNPKTGKISHFAILLDPSTGELVQSTGKKAGCVSMTLDNQKDWSNLVDMRVNWSGEYKDWNWGCNDESAHPDNIYIVNLVDLS